MIDGDIALKDSIDFAAKSMDYVAKNELLLVPLLLLVIIYALKYFFGNNFNKKSVLEFLLEFPVDFGFIGITFVMTYFFLELDSAPFGKIMILVCILIAIVNSTLRRIALKHHDKDDAKIILIGLYGIINASLSIAFVWYILKCINL